MDQEDEYPVDSEESKQSRAKGCRGACVCCGESLGVGDFNTCAQCRAKEVETNRKFYKMLSSRRFLAYLVLVLIVAVFLGVQWSFGHSLILIGVAIPLPTLFLIRRAIRK